MFVDGPGDEGSVFLTSGTDRTCYPASHYAPIEELPDPADYYHHLFAQDES
jgi:hypothetical protein